MFSNLDGVLTDILYFTVFFFFKLPALLFLSGFLCVLAFTVPYYPFSGLWLFALPLLTRLFVYRETVRGVLGEDLCFFLLV